MMIKKYNLRENYIQHGKAYSNKRLYKTPKSLKLFSLLILSFINSTKATNNSNINSTCCFNSLENRYLLNLLDRENISYFQNNTELACIFPFQINLNKSIENQINSLNCSKNIKIDSKSPMLLYDNKRRLQEKKNQNKTDIICTCFNQFNTKCCKKEVAIIDLIQALVFIFFAIFCCICIPALSKTFKCITFSLGSLLFILTLINSIYVFSSKQGFIPDWASITFFCITLLITCLSCYTIKRHCQDSKSTRTELQPKATYELTTGHQLEPLQTTTATSQVENN